MFLFPHLSLTSFVSPFSSKFAQDAPLVCFDSSRVLPETHRDLFFKLRELIYAVRATEIHRTYTVHS